MVELSLPSAKLKSALVKLRLGRTHSFNGAA
jgi:hypothetical protein